MRSLNRGEAQFAGLGDWLGARLAMSASTGPDIAFAAQKLTIDRYYRKKGSSSV